MSFYIDGISCSKCVRKLETLPLQLRGLKRVEVEMGKKVAHVEIDKQRTTFAEVAQSIVGLGFSPIPIDRTTDEQELARRDERRQLIRLGVAGACASNIMMFALATYFGDTADLKSLFYWLSFALYLPVVTYVALPFYRGAFQSIKNRQISIDLPMTIASLAGFVFSTVQLLRGRDDIYFDSLSGFLFLILLSRYVQQKLQRKYLRPESLSESLQLSKTRVLKAEDQWEWRPTEKLEAGLRIRMEEGETVPADGELLATRAHFSMAWLSGESRPKVFEAGSIIPAGARLMDSEVDLQIVRPLNETNFGQILKQIAQSSLSRNQWISTSDRWAQWLLGTVLTIAVLFLVLYWSVSPEQAAARALALIILACPCAMAFGTPLAVAVALRRAQKNGIVVRDANVFERLISVETIFFDKTGTLTDSELSLRESPADVPAVFHKIILALEQPSFHPIAFAFRRALSAPEGLPPVEGWREISGQGVAGYLFGRFYELKRSARVSDTMGCSLFEDGKPIHNFTFIAKTRPDARQTLDELRQLGYKTELLSGDQFDVARHLGQELGFAENQIHAAMNPCDKAAHVRRHPHSMMVGDGINDSLALLQAQVGVAVAGGVESALKSSHVYLTEECLVGVTKLVQISKQAQTMIRQNLTLSIIYNSIGGVLALLGYVNPFVAALLMPASSGLILLATWIRGQE